MIVVVIRKRLSSLTVAWGLVALTAFAGDGSRDAGVPQSALLPLTPLVEPTGAPSPVLIPAGLGTGVRPVMPVRIGAIVARGPLDKALVRRVLRAHLGLLKQCSTLHAAADAGAGAIRLEVDFVITATGAVSEAKVTRSSVGNKDLEACVVNVVRQRVFPLPLDGGVVTVDLPLEFVSSPAH